MDAAGPGTTVELAWSGLSTSQTATVTTSGAAGNPITIKPAPGYTPAVGQILGNAGTTPALAFSGANYVDVTGIALGGVSTRFAYLDGSSHIDFDEDGFNWEQFEPNSSAGPVFEITGSSSDIALTRSTIVTAYQGAGVAVQLDSGTTGNVIAGNVITQGSIEGSGTQAAIAATGATGTEITSNTIRQYGPFCGSTVVLAGASMGSTLENNVLENTTGGCSGGTGLAVLEVDPTSEVGLTDDYNLLYATPRDPLYTMPAYEWGTVTYSTVSAFAGASGQGSHDLIANPQPETGASPTINSANSAAPGMPATDLDGDSCSYDPYVPVTGAGSPAYCTRGATQYQSSPLTAALTITPDNALGVDAYDSAQLPANPQGYSINWGDGTTTQGSAYAGTHSYTSPGTYTITETVTDELGGTASASTTFTTAGSDFTPVAPSRILDTRKGTGTDEGPVASGGVVKLKVAGTGSIPAGISAVVLNLTAVEATGNGFVSAYADGSSAPNVSNLNYGTAGAVANVAIVPVGSDGYVDLLNTGVNASVNVELIADATGYFSPTLAGTFAATQPTRVLDTRKGTGAAQAKVGALSSIPLTIEGSGAGIVPASGVTAVSLHVTSVDAAANGFITAYPDGQSTPTASNLNYTTGSTVSNTVIVPVGSDGKIRLYNGSPTGTVDLIADVTGYYSSAGNGFGAVYVPLTPTRVEDTRKGKAMIPGSTVGFRPVTPANQMPLGGTAYVLNLTVTSATGNGLITVYPANGATPNTSNLNYLAGQTVANLTQVLGGLPSVNDDSTVTAKNTENGGSVQFIADVFGYYTSY